VQSFLHLGRSVIGRGSICRGSLVRADGHALSEEFFIKENFVIRGKSPLAKLRVSVVSGYNTLGFPQYS
jgi:hypothetical protein